ncbi:MAG: hypothetical protein GDA43_01540 [Hormoscilla sp. SP5CHS1]|nr:hypothetical protein [Hormoscilla sp. SP5CHS1]
MTRFIYDQFHKDYLDEFLKCCGEVQIDMRVPSEVREIDVWFVPNPEKSAQRQTLGLLGRMAATSAIFEPFHSAATADEICDCMVKLRDVCRQEQRSGRRQGQKGTELPRLWVLTPTASTALLSEFGAKLDKSWLSGVDFLPKKLRTAIVVIHKLPYIPETLWLRLLGKGRIQTQAIDELKALPPEHPNREMTLKLLLNFHQNLSARQDLDLVGRKFVMQLAPLLDMQLEEKLREGIQQGIQQGAQQGAQQERRLTIENLLKFRFGDIDASLVGLVEQILALSSEDFARLIMELPQLSRSDLVSRLASLDD